ncbi:unnamed protein product [Fraxinus pennsylvanica]|uniref:Uncharacterized protein n=1 Tax=Fraxinus pennsylvanica TaxID=56036 RepID=A0AAD1Z7X2_9LAMI|nr:unnamed protein product [Fraxinus pennsylvanica]
MDQHKDVYASAPFSTNSDQTDTLPFGMQTVELRGLLLWYNRVLLTMIKIAPYSEDIAEAARIKHLEFKENHLKWLEDGNLHSAVFEPADIQINGSGDAKFSTKPKYRGKYV